MAVEIERKFLVKNDSWRTAVESQAHIMQGYLADRGGVTVRVRVKADRAWLTVKGATTGISRREFEYPVPLEDARVMLRELALDSVIDKIRYQVRCGGHRWDLDLFAGENEGLVMAEVELGCEQEVFALPDWAGQEVSGDSRYYNSNLAINPYKRWA